ncbi:MAG TPA: Gx transporter family protein [Bacillota bacterium]|nr:Gx transporter family protein [Bacillota bacterium]HQB81388.1 Gx transporter family protein [Bacillota bacterium]
MKTKGAQRRRLRRLTLDAMLVSLALVLALVERWIPLELIVPVPGLKLGLANIVTLVALMRLHVTDALAILLVRIMIMSAITGITTMLFSLGGGLLALVVMWLLSFLEGRSLSVIGMSMAGAAAHNIGQVGVASLVLAEPLLLVTYLPPLLITGLLTGVLTGAAAGPVIRNLTALPLPQHKEEAS